MYRCVVYHDGKLTSFVALLREDFVKYSFHFANGPFKHRELLHTRLANKQHPNNLAVG